MDLTIQDKDKSRQLLAAQDRLYARAKWWTYLVILATLAPPASLLLKSWVPEINNWVSIAGGLGLMLVFGLNQLIKDRVQKAALIQEEFDTDIFQWDWNAELGESRVKEIERMKAAGKYVIPETRLPWYSIEIAKLPDNSIQILLCQKENVEWDWLLKKRFANILAGIFWLVLLCILCYGLANSETTVRYWVLQCLLPFSAFLYNNFELWQSFRKVSAMQQALTDDIQAEIDAFKKSKKAIPVERLRLFQNRIFRYRLKNSLVPDWFFNLSKQGYQTLTTASTKEIIQKLNA